MKSLFYKIIYSRYINFYLRNLNKLFISVLKFRIPPAGRVTIELSNAEVIQFHTNQTDYVSFCVFWKGLHGYEYIQIFEDVISKCRGFIDVGANAGLYSIIAAKTSQNITVLAFDPTDAATYYLKKNIDENKVSKQVTCYQLAASDKQEKITFFKVKNPKYPYLDFNLGGTSGFLEKPVHYDEIKVQAVALDAFITAKHPEMKIDFVKIDAENAEPLIINGMKNLLLKHQAIVVCEVMFDRVIIELEQIFKELSYDFYFHIDKKLVKVNSLQDKTKYEDVRNCFFVPEAKKDLISKWL